LTKYRNVQELDNRDPYSPLARKLAIEWLGYQDEYDTTTYLAPKPFADCADIACVQAGQYAILRIRNAMEPGFRNDPARILNIAVLDLQPDWGITQIYPTGAAAIEPLDPGAKIELPIRMTLPDTYQDGIDTFKVLATIDATDFRWLELPRLDQPMPKKRNHLSKHTLLELLLASVAEDGPLPGCRNGTAYSAPGREWVTAQVEIRTIPASSGSP
jgi:hypothetical protein